jgi:hypothetical protein
VECSCISWKLRERLEELENPFSRQPVGDGQERGSPPITEVAHTTFWRSCDVPSRGDDSNPRLREPSFDEQLREVVARREQQIRSAECEPIERRLCPRANG